ncbi:DUF1298 domain-containing protein [Streptosporangiaceae bacterium NEAU-GS5]|nr:DUF1298 domain-containing protein [Streptosporangiaceae bacterium NEAU-GS5]
MSGRAGEDRGADRRGAFHGDGRLPSSRALFGEIRTVATRPWTIMEVRGGQGIDELLTSSAPRGYGGVPRVRHDPADEHHGPAHDHGHDHGTRRVLSRRTRSSTGRSARTAGFAFCSLSFDQVKQAKVRFGVTVNDVVLALCAGAVRRWLLDRDALPAGPLVAGVPVAQPVRAGGNRLTLMMAAFPTHLDDPADRVGATAESMAAVKARAAESSWVDDVTGLLPPALAAPLTRAAFWLAARTITPLNLIISNVPGPQVPLYVCGARLIAHYPVSVVTDVSGAVNITVFSYDGALHVGVIASRDLDLDLWDLTGHIEAELGTLTG